MKFRYSIFPAAAIAAFALSVSPSAAQSSGGRQAISPPTPAPRFDHSGFDAVVRRHVGEDGLVDYAALLKDRKPLDDYLALLGTVTGAQFARWPRNEQMAYYINAYNAITLARIIDRYPPTGLGLIWPRVSIKNISGVWDKLTNRVAGEMLTLDDIEHKRLRANYNDPRIHAAVNCASISCPLLWNRAYSAAKLDEELDEASRRFARDPKRNRIDAAKKEIEISKIFDWYADDFKQCETETPKLAGARGAKGKFAGAIGYLVRFGDPAVAEFLKSGDYDIEIADYDWSLNGK
jgi:hypothetical protein